MRPSRWALWGMLGVLLLLCACAEEPARVVLRGATMGTTWSVIYAPPPESAKQTKQTKQIELTGQYSGKRELQLLIESELSAINDALSTYIPESEISRLNAAQATVSQRLSARFAEVLDAALSLGALTGGAYDVTVGPLVELWGFGATTSDRQLPTGEEIALALENVGASRLSWNPDTALLIRPDGMRIDLSSIAKGYAVDRLTSVLQSHGVENALVEIGGELRAMGERPEGGLWRLAIESPDPEEGRFIEALNLTDTAVATSGDYRNYFELDGRRYSHLVDARTGYPVEHELVSVTVVDKQCMRADALATALIILGLDEALALAQEMGLAAMFVSRAAAGLDVHYTARFEVYIRQSNPES